MIRESALPGGARLLTEEMPHVRSASIGIFVDVGSSHETPERRGISHLLEHMLFKGTPRRSARRIAEEMDAVGGNLNAATDKELTMFYAQVTDAELPVAADVLADMFLNASLDAAELRKERKVVLDEIKMYDDAPDEVIADLFAATLWQGANLAEPTIGFAHTVSSVDRAALSAWYRERYAPGGVLVAAAGRLDHDALGAQLSAAFGDATGQAPAAQAERPAFRAAVTVRRDDTEQAYVMVGAPGLSLCDERRYALAVLDAILGGGMSSRLFQEVREERGLAYEIASFQQAYRAAGLFGISAGTSPERVQECVDVIVDQLDLVVDRGVTSAEVRRARAHLKGNLTLALESTASRMSRLARNAALYGRQIPTEEMEARFDAVGVDDVNALARELLGGERGLCILGPVDEDAVRLRRAGAV